MTTTIQLSHTSKYLLATLIVCIGLLLTPATASAQQAVKRCATDEVNNWFRLAHPKGAAMQDRLQQNILKQAKRLKQFRTENNSQEIVVPIAFHIVWNAPQEKISRDQIMNQLQVLNNSFSGIDPQFDANTPAAFKPLKANVGIRFCLGQYYDENGKLREAIKYVNTSQTGFNSGDKAEAIKFDALGGSDSFLPTEYLNVWVCNLNGVLGYATFPGYPQDREGIVCGYEYFGLTAHPDYGLGKTLVHEVGHFFFLRHVWGDEACGHDFIDDTPPCEKEVFGVLDPVADFPFKQGKCSDEPNGEMWTNYMNYFDDVSLTMFSLDQKDVMRATLAVGGTRETLLYSNACQKPYRMQANCCPDIQDIEAITQGPSSIGIQWSHQKEAANGYEVRFRPFWEANWSVPIVIKKNEHDFTGLLSEKSYFFQVRSLCADGSKGAWKSVSYHTSGTCTVPTTYQVSSTENSITVNWNEPPSPDFEQIVLSKSPPNSSQFFPLIGPRIKTNTHTFTNLEKGTRYFLRLRWRCLNRRRQEFKQFVWTAGCQPPMAPFTFYTFTDSIFVEPGPDDPRHDLVAGSYRVKGTTIWSPEREGAYQGVGFGGLQPNTLYEFQVRAKCVDGNYSEYTLTEKATDPVVAPPPNEPPVVEALTIYPNPATSGTPVTIEQPTGTENMTTIQVLNSNGEAIREEEVSGSGAVTMVLGRLSPGLYLIITRNGTQVQTKRLLITR